MKTQTRTNPNTGDMEMLTTLTMEQMTTQVMPKIYEEVIRQLAQAISENYLKEHEQEIIAKIDQQALANLVVAEAGNSIKDMLDKKLPDRVETIVKREVYQRGIFGGISRVA